MTFHVEQPHDDRARPRLRPTLGVAAEIHQLRYYRVRPAPEKPAGDPLAEILKQADRARQEAAATGRGVMSAMPDVLRKGLDAWSVDRGRLVLVIRSPARRKRAMDWLRGGGEAALRRESGGRVTRVVVRHR